MGCGTSKTDSLIASSNHRASGETRARLTKSPSLLPSLKSTILIQRWYRRYLARLEARRRYTWSIFQSLEYAGEQDQLRLYNFFNDLMTHMTELQDSADGSSRPDKTKTGVLQAINGFPRPISRVDSRAEEDRELFKLTDPNNVTVGLTYKGPHLKFPIMPNQLESLLEAFKQKQTLHAKYILEVCHAYRAYLKNTPNINRVSTAKTQQVTVVGDLHGKLDDLLIIFYKNGLPGISNPYIFNGDFVDRGGYSVEIAILLFVCSLITPNSVYINRGNHEDHVMNLRYGFIKEIMGKYRKEHATKIVRLFEDLFSWLPLATIIDEKILVCHGGISDHTDLNYLSGIDRHKYISALRPPSVEDEDGEEEVDLLEWRQVLDILWSDPRPVEGCSANTFRGGGCYFGPDVTKKILTKFNLQLLIRSHECKSEGYEFNHDNKVLTIFSASNYYEEGSNKGAYVKFTSDLHPHIVQYMASKRPGRRMTIKQRININESSALGSLKAKIYANKSMLKQNFSSRDPKSTGLISVKDWVQIMTIVLEIDLPWRGLKDRLVRCSETGMVIYSSTFEDLKLQTKLSEDDSSGVTEALMRHKETLETIFRAMDKDNSGFISLSEFEEACVLLSQHTKSILSREDIISMAKSMDINKDGYIDFNEFLEAFRIVDKFGRELQRRYSNDGGSEGETPKRRTQKISQSTDQTVIDD